MKACSSQSVVIMYEKKAQIHVHPGCDTIQIVLSFIIVGVMSFGFYRLKKIWMKIFLRIFCAYHVA